MPGAWAAGLGQLSVHYGNLNDAGNVGVADLTVSSAMHKSPGLLHYLGDDIRYDVTLGGFFDQADGDVPFVYAGPTWEYHPDILWPGNYVELGTAVTYLAQSHVGDSDLGGHWQFTTHATLGVQFGPARRWRVGLRLQHTSNAGLEPPNPGLDAAVIELGYRL